VITITILTDQTLCENFARLLASYLCRKRKALATSGGNSGRGGANGGPPCTDKGNLEEQEKSESNEVVHPG